MNSQDFSYCDLSSSIRVLNTYYGELQRSLHLNATSLEQVDWWRRKTDHTRNFDMSVPQSLLFTAINATSQETALYDIYISIEPAISAWVEDRSCRNSALLRHFHPQHIRHSSALLPHSPFEANHSSFCSPETERVIFNDSKIRHKCKIRRYRIPMRTRMTFWDICPPIGSRCANIET